MSLKLDGIDLNSDIVSVEGGNEVYGVNVSESTVRTSVSAIETLTGRPLGLGQVDGCSVEGVSGDIGVFRDSVDAFHGADENLRQEEVVGGVVGEGLEGRSVPVDEENQMESEMKSYDRGNDTGAANVSTMPVIDVSKCKEVIVGGEIAKNDGLVLDLRDDGRSCDAYCGDSSCSQKNEGGNENFSTGAANVSTMPVVDVSKCKEVIVGGEIAKNDGLVLDLRDEGRSCDAYCGDSSCSQKNEGGNENFSTFYVDRVIKYGETIKDEEAKVADTDDSLLERNGNMAAYGSGEVTVGELADSTMEFKTWVDTDENRIMGGSDSEAGVSQHYLDEVNMISLVVDLNPRIGAEANLKSGNGIGNLGTEVKEFSGDTFIPFSAQFADNATCSINGAGLNGNQGVVNTEQMTDIEQAQDTEKKNVRSGNLKLECYRKRCRTEKEGEFSVSDLVWGKVRSHPWWPGQIFDPSDSSEKATKYYKKDSLLIAYFGDQTFAWNEASRIKPFRMHFSQMYKQSSSEAFCHAVDCALDEVSRRVEFGLACSCLPEEVNAKVKSQFIVNAGIREESSRRNGGDEISSVYSFNPVDLIQYLKALAQSPYGGTDRLEFVITRAKLLAFNHWKGYYQLPEFQMLGGMLENDVNISLLGKREESDEVIEGAVPGSKDDEQVPSGKGKSVSHKRKNISGDVVYPSKKERRVSDLMSGSCTDLLNGESEPENKAGRKLTSSSGKKRKAVDSISDGLAVKSRNSVETSKPFLRIGETIRKVASQLALSTPILKYDSQKTSGENGSNKKPSRASFGVPPCSSKKSRGRKKFTPVEYLPPDEMLSQLCLIARDPMKEYSFLISIVSFLSDFRNSFCLKNANSQKQKKSTGEVSGEQTGKRSSNSETTETSGFEGMEDSYWTDRIIQSNTEEQVLFEPETPNENGAPTLEPAAALEPTPKSDSKQEASVVNHELEAGNLAGHVDDKFEQEYSPTALILNFTDLDSVPSETNLNKIFCRYGPLNETETEVLKKGNRAKVVFQRRSDAETAFSSAGKFSIFGPSLVSYRLNYSPTPRKTPTSSTKGRRKDAAFLEGNAV